MVDSRFVVRSACGLCFLFTTLGQPRACADEPNSNDARREVIVYTTLRPPNWDVYIFEQRGKPPRRLTDDPALDYNATFSPDGKWVVFTSERRGNADLFAIECDKKDAKPIPLTSHEGMEDAANFSPDGSTIVFVSTRDGNADIFSTPFDPGKADAEKRANPLTRHPHGDFNPAFSPDGKQIAFSRAEQDSSFVHVMNADGTDARDVSKTAQQGGTPAWSADGKSLYFYSANLLKGVQLFRINVDGTDAKILSPEGVSVFSPTVMPGGRIAFSRGPDLAPGDLLEMFRPGGEPRIERETLATNTRIWSVDLEGKDLRQESDGEPFYAAPRYHPKTGRMVCHGPGPTEGQPLMKNGNPFARPSGRWHHKFPDGRTVEVHAVRGYFPSLGPKGEVAHTPWVHPKNYGLPPIVICDLDGKNMRSLDRPREALPWCTTLTRDGQWLFFSLGAAFGGPKDKCDIWKMQADGGGARNLTPDDMSNNAFPDVSADGKTVVFRSLRDGNKEIYLMDSDGQNQRRLTNDPAIDTMPAISPDGKWVVFSKGKSEAGMMLCMMPTNGEDTGQYLEPARVGKTGNDMHPRFSPDGKWIAFVSNRSGLNDEFALSAGNPQPAGELWALPIKDGKATGAAIRLTHDKWEDGLPSWGYAPNAARSSR